MSAPSASSIPTSAHIIQGGMGIGVSSWRLARAVAVAGEIGVISGTGIDTVVVRELQDGDPNGRLRMLEDYPDQEIVRLLSERYFISGGRGPGNSYRLLPIHRFKPTRTSQRILSAATYSEALTGLPRNARIHVPEGGGFVSDAFAQR